MITALKRTFWPIFCFNGSFLPINSGPCFWSWPATWLLLTSPSHFLSVLVSLWPLFGSSGYPRVGAGGVAVWVTHSHGHTVTLLGASYINGRLVGWSGFCALFWWPVLRLTYLTVLWSFLTTSLSQQIGASPEWGHSSITSVLSICTVPDI